MSFNATAAIHSTVHDLYAHTDFSNLSWFEQKWVAWYLFIGDASLATGLMSFLLHEFVYFGRSIPWVIIDAIPYFRRWKLQPNKIPTAKEQWECTKGVLFSHFTIELPTIWLFHPLTELFGMRTWQVPFPTWQEIVFQVAIFFVYEDMFHFFAHQFLHWPPAYKFIHKIHHKNSAPFGLAAEYCHPLEVLILGAGTLSGPMLYAVITGDFHIMTMYIWITLRLFQAIDAHSGYDFPWSLHNFVPFWAGAEHHDFHHMAFVNNYSTSFRWCDRLFGTDKKYLEYVKKVKDAKKAAKNHEEFLKIEQRLMDETLDEGFREEADVLGAQKVKTS